MNKIKWRELHQLLYARCRAQTSRRPIRPYWSWPSPSVNDWNSSAVSTALVSRSISTGSSSPTYVIVIVVSRVVFVGGKTGNFPLTGSDLPSHWFVWKLRGMERGREGKEKGEGGETTCLTSPHWFLPQIPAWSSAYDCYRRASSS